MRIKSIMQGQWLRTGIIIMVLIFVAMPLLVFAEDDELAGDKSLWDLVKAGGIVGFVIIILSVVTMALTIEHSVNIKRDKLCPPDVVAELESLVEEGQYEEAMNLCSVNPNFFCNIIGASLSKVNEGYDEMVKIMEETGEEEANKLNQKISYISLIGNVAPMMGLLGTVMGMINAFTIIEQAGSPSPRDLAKGIYEALVTTCMGLIVAIPALSIFFFFKNKVTQFIIEIGMICGEFLEKFKQTTTDAGPQT